MTPRNEAFGVMNGYQSTIGNHVALRFDEFFHGIFKTPQITNGNLIVAVLLVESNTMSI